MLEVLYYEMLEVFAQDDVDARQLVDGERHQRVVFVVLVCSRRLVHVVARNITVD